MNKFLPYLQLMRLPNVFTAMADIFMGFLFVHPSLHPADEFFLLLVSSSCLYTAGMVLNDLFDLAADARLRPQRPLPSGRVSKTTAIRISAALIAAGVGAAFLCSAVSGTVALLLVASVFLYDGLFKSTPVAPIFMGCCRLLNVLLGMSTAASGIPDLGMPLAAEWQVGLAMGLYVTGVTWFARREAETSSRWQLGLAAGVINAGFLTLAAAATDAAFVYRDYYWILLAIIVWRVDQRLIAAIALPRPASVQAAVKTSLMSLVPLNAMVVCGVQSPWWALTVLALLVPFSLLARWVYST